MANANDLVAALTQSLNNQATLVATLDTKLSAILVAVAAGQVAESTAQALLDKAVLNEQALQAALNKLPDVTPA